MGNICRSPTAEGVFRSVVADAGLADSIIVDSAGTHSYHLGHPPDRRSQAAALARGYDLSSLRARRVSEADFLAFDHILAMDRDNYEHLQRLQPDDAVAELDLFLSFDGNSALSEVPDPYYGGARGFEHVLDLVESASRGLLAHTKRRLGSPAED